MQSKLSESWSGVIVACLIISFLVMLNSGAIGFIALLIVLAMWIHRSYMDAVLAEIKKGKE